MGGRAFDDVIPVPYEVQVSIINWYIAALGNPTSGLLGSTMKQKKSGDIDLAISDNQWAFESLACKMEELLGVDNVNRQGRNLNQVYTRYTTPSGDKYQVDLMIGDVDLLKFTHFSPRPDESAYSGAHRTELIKTVAKVVSTDQVWIGNRMVARYGYTLYHEVGLMMNPRWCPRRKDGQGFTVKMVAVKPEDIDEFKNAFPLMPDYGISLEEDPYVICRLLFGNSQAYSRVNSYEGVAEMIKASPVLAPQADLIWDLYCDRLDQIKQPHPVRMI